LRPSITTPTIVRRRSSQAQTKTRDRSGPRGLVTDAEGRISLPALIPGALYRIVDFSTGNDPDKGVQVRKDFTVKPAETVDLGDILIEKPQP
jgi:hypothetical protein